MHAFGEKYGEAWPLMRGMTVERIVRSGPILEPGSFSSVSSGQSGLAIVLMRRES